LLLYDECPKCGAQREAEADSRFCLACGTYLKISESKTAQGNRANRAETKRSAKQGAQGLVANDGNGSSEALHGGKKLHKVPRFAIPAALIAIVVVVASALLIPLFTSGEHGGNSEYVGEWYVPTDTDRRINISSDGSVTYGDENHGTIASGKWTVIDEDAGAIKFTLKAQSGNEKMFEEGPSEFTRMAYAESTNKMTAQLYYSPSEWETYIKQQ